MTGGRPARRKNFLQRTTIWIPAGVIGLLMLPLAATSRTFGDDWTLHLWLVRQQEMNIRANGRPGLFLSAKPLGAFYPVFAFVGSGLYNVGGYLAIMLGDRPILAYKLLYLGALCLAYGGMTWLSWLVGLRGWRSQMPGLVFVTGAYYVTDMFARGDLGELMALSAIPLLIAAVTAVAVSRRLEPVHLLGVVVAVFVFTGSHNITLLYGTIFLVLLGLVLLGAFGPVGRSLLSRLPWRRLPALVAAGAIGLGLNAWYLVADLKYGTRTATAKVNQHVVPTTSLSQWRLLLNPLRPSDPSFADTTHDLRMSLPWLFTVWAIVFAVIAWRRIDGVGRRLIVFLTGLAALYLCLIVSQTPWKSFPHVLYNIQFTLRLHAYVLLATALLMMVALVWQARSDEATRHATSAALAIIAVFTVGAATWQAWIVPSTYQGMASAVSSSTSGGPLAVRPRRMRGRSEMRAPGNFADVVVASRYVRPPSWYQGGDFRDVSGPIVDMGFAHELIVPEADVRGSTYRGVLEGVRDGPGPFRTNISAGLHLVQISGITPIGISGSGFVVAERTPGSPLTGPVDVTIRQAPTRLLHEGSGISKISLDALAALAAWTLIAWLWQWMGPALFPQHANRDERPTTNEPVA
ncbi:MAG TPA: hypothetical protein VIK61_00185 [Acidimicrobiia bacterium]